MTVGNWPHIKWDPLPRSNPREGQRALGGTQTRAFSLAFVRPCGTGPFFLVPCAVSGRLPGVFLLPGALRYRFCPWCAVPWLVLHEWHAVSYLCRWSPSSPTFRRSVGLPVRTAPRHLPSRGPASAVPGWTGTGIRVIHWSPAVEASSWFFPVVLPLLHPTGRLPHYGWCRRLWPLIADCWSGVFMRTIINSSVLLHVWTCLPPRAAFDWWLFLLPNNSCSCRH